jgi:alkylated DNA repair dioxygenase AlkB
LADRTNVLWRKLSPTFTFLGSAMDHLLPARRGPMATEWAGSKADGAGDCSTVSPASKGRPRQLHDNQAAVAVLNHHGANVEYAAGFLTPGEELQFRHALERAVVFDSAQASRVFVHGRWHDIPRRQCAHGDDDCPCYRFSGVQVQPRPWILPLREVRGLVAERIGFRANFVLVNHYAHAGQHISWHADDERDLDPAAPIASLSLGGARVFQFRPCARGAAPGTVTMMLEPGSLLMMYPPTNAKFQHCLPKRSGARAAAAVGVRWNLTFRRMVGAAWR